MRNIYVLIVLALLMLACGEPVQVRVKINGEENIVCRLVTPDTSFTVKPDSTGWAVITMPKDGQPGYGSLICGKKKLPLYFNGEDFDMTVTPAKDVLHAAFSGDGAKINTYLNMPSLARWEPNYWLKDEAFTTMLDSTENAFSRRLDSCRLDKGFVQKEKQRIHYLVQGKYVGYPAMYTYYTCVLRDLWDGYYRRVKGLLVEDNELLELAEYKRLLIEVVFALSKEGLPIQNTTPLENLKMRMNYIADTFKDPAVISYLTDYLISFHVKSKGMENQAYFGPIYAARVLDVKAKEKFAALCAQWAVLAPGQPSPDFCYPDVDGKEVCLKDLAGKYIYIDLWATWCGPCCAEIPALQKLEHRYAGKDIHFVSISSDENQKAWKNKVKGENMTGIQLNVNENMAFMDAYLVVGIPRFILLDREGEIISADMTRPSDSKTQEFLDNLLK